MHTLPALLPLLPTSPTTFKYITIPPASARFTMSMKFPTLTTTPLRASLSLPALSRWLREPDTMKQEVGRTHSEVFQNEPPNFDEKKPSLEVKDSTRSVEPGTTLRWRFVKSTTPIEKDIPLIELNGDIGFQKDYCADPDNLWADLSSPLPFVFFHPILPLYIDTRKEGSLARYVRRSCKPNAQLDTYLSGGSEYHFWLVSDRHIPSNEQITLPWDFRLEKSVHARWLHLLGLSDDDTTSQDEPELDASEYTAISNWIDRILSEYGGCACDLENNCAFARFHRHYLFGKHNGRLAKKRSRKSRNQAISPTSTGHATNSRAASEGQVDDSADNGARNESSASRSKPTSRDPTPVLQGQFDQLGILTEPTDRDKRKVAMVEDSFRRMEQQQPPRKKKRMSDGTMASTSSKPKSRNSSAAPPNQYVDAGTSRSKSGSPSSARSPSLTNLPRPSASVKASPVIGSRQASTGARSTYCDTGVQTDPVEGEWFSEPCKSQCGKRRVISLSKRLLNSRLKNWGGEGEAKRQDLSGQVPGVGAMDVDAPASEPKPPVLGLAVDPQSPTPLLEDLHSPRNDSGSAHHGQKRIRAGARHGEDSRSSGSDAPRSSFRQQRARHDASVIHGHRRTFTFFCWYPVQPLCPAGSQRHSDASEPSQEEAEPQRLHKEQDEQGCRKGLRGGPLSSSRPFRAQRESKSRSPMSQNR